MGLLDQLKRVELEGGQWVDVRPLSVSALREMRRAVALMEPQPGEEPAETQGFELTRMALEACVAAWSDDAEVTPENIGRLPYQVSIAVAQGLGLGEKERPLPSGLPSTDSSPVNLEE